MVSFLTPPTCTSGKTRTPAFLMMVSARSLGPRRLSFASTARASLRRSRKRTWPLATAGSTRSMPPWPESSTGPGAPPSPRRFSGRAGRQPTPRWMTASRTWMPPSTRLTALVFTRLRGRGRCCCRRTRRCQGTRAFTLPPTLRKSPSPVPAATFWRPSSSRRGGTSPTIPRPGGGLRARGSARARRGRRPASASCTISWPRRTPFGPCLCAPPRRHLRARMR
mmetsp:Transcript_59424/g.181317  ORF Transcript_59424/g.181317 Transcript_59424/m.181317 type:complete len:223 (-) Transcript_59424:756-1424(-)